MPCQNSADITGQVGVRIGHRPGLRTDQLRSYF
jgi:hypothetical protein